jgi:hypothetical protein
MRGFGLGLAAAGIFLAGTVLANAAAHTQTMPGAAGSNASTGPAMAGQPKAMATMKSSKAKKATKKKTAKKM